ncbi:ankyrin repeat domain-containing protein [Herbaspirillum sp. RTI4]|uniref:ankyrin repeat domain-containing protein n=1 Tax=Herbaspirillum sp. RTI4 TaxID=3048640 RepID=UPI002AB52BDB|nr:ankyrin repeat domain-containing protein [Herbaspirillum sp. RTI4]MDY7579643.1 ankyrin repeat domain-containing protein [Herbaspirillum sp. RTI4]MEA9981858.1 ankyrin repeat domain-containing protein [Herbaspirillum sp. RTI4]
MMPASTSHHSAGYRPTPIFLNISDCQIITAQTYSPPSPVRTPTDQRIMFDSAEFHDFETFERQGLYKLSRAQLIESIDEIKCFVNRATSSPRTAQEICDALDSFLSSVRFAANPVRETVYGKLKAVLHRICDCLLDEDIALHLRLKAVQEFALGVIECISGASNALDKILNELELAGAGFSGHFAQMLEDKFNSEVAEFVQQLIQSETKTAQKKLLLSYETHIGRYYRDRYGEMVGLAPAEGVDMHASHLPHISSKHNRLVEQFEQNLLKRLSATSIAMELSMRLKEELHAAIPADLLNANGEFYVAGCAALERHLSLPETRLHYGLISPSAVLQIQDNGEFKLASAQHVLACIILKNALDENIIDRWEARIPRGLGLQASAAGWNVLGLGELFWAEAPGESTPQALTFSLLNDCKAACVLPSAMLLEALANTAPEERLTQLRTSWLGHPTGNEEPSPSNSAQVLAWAIRHNDAALFEKIVAHYQQYKAAPDESDMAMLIDAQHSASSAHYFNKLLTHFFPVEQGPALLQQTIRIRAPELLNALVRQLPFKNPELKAALQQCVKENFSAGCRSLLETHADLLHSIEHHRGSRKEGIGQNGKSQASFGYDPSLLLDVQSAEIARMLITAGAEINVRVPLGREKISPLGCAIRMERNEVAVELYSAGALLLEQDMSDLMENPVLLKELLIKRTPSFFDTEQPALTMLRTALLEGQISSAELLLQGFLERNAANPKKLHKLFEPFAPRQNDLLTYAVSEGHASIVEIFLKYSHFLNPADLNESKRSDGFNALMLAARIGNRHMLKMLLRCEAIELHPKNRKTGNNTTWDFGRDRELNQIVRERKGLRPQPAEIPM